MSSPTGDRMEIYMNARKRFLYNGALLCIVGLAIKTVGIAFSAFIGRAVGSEALGLFTLIGSLYSFAVTFASAGMSLTVTRLVAGAVGEGKRCEISRIMRHATLYSLIFSCTAALVLFLGAPYFAHALLSDKRAVKSLRILSFSLVPIALTSVMSGYFIGVKRVKRSAALQVASQFFKIAISVFFVSKMSGQGAESAVTALAVSTTLTELFSLALSFLQYAFEPKNREKSSPVSNFADVATANLPLAFSAYIRSALLTLEHVLIPHSLRRSGSDEAGALASYGILHGMALPAVLYPMSPLSSFAGLLVPEFAEDMARGDEERVRRVTSTVLNTTLAYAIPCAVFMYMFSSELGYVIYSSHSAGSYIAMLAPVLPIMYLDHVTDAILKGIGEQVYSMWVNITDSALSVILIVVLIPKMGIGGYALVIIIMEGYNFLLSFLRLRKKIDFKFSVTGTALPAFLSSVTAAVVADRLFPFGGIMTSPLWLVLKIVFSVCLFIGIYRSFSFLRARFISIE